MVFPSWIRAGAAAQEASPHKGAGSLLFFYQSLRQTSAQMQGAFCFFHDACPQQQFHKSLPFQTHHIQGRPPMLLLRLFHGDLQFIQGSGQGCNMPGYLFVFCAVHKAPPPPQLQTAAGKGQAGKLCIFQPRFPNALAHQFLFYAGSKAHRGLTLLSNSSCSSWKSL